MTRYAMITFWSDADAAWIADAPDLKPCSAFGGTPEQAVAELSVAMEAWLAAAKKTGHRLPEARFQPQHAAAE